MRTLVVVGRPEHWPLKVPGVEVVSARSYLTEPAYQRPPGLRVLNLWGTYRYQSLGYYVSLLAAARGHRPMPDVSTLRDFLHPHVCRIVSDDLDALVQRSLAALQGSRFTLSIYFGRNMARRYDRLSQRLFHLFRAPLLRAFFVRNHTWKLQHVGPITVNAVPAAHRPFLVEAASTYLSGGARPLRRRPPSRYSLAILRHDGDPTPPSNGRALRRFIRAAERLGMEAECIGKEDRNRLAAFDALFIRETTQVDHHTYRFARHAQAEGMVVIDDPDSIIKCTNKVFLTEALRRYQVRIPETVILHRENVEEVLRTLPFPCILKRPDGSYSMGVVKVDTEEEFRERVEEMLGKSDLVLAQEFLPTPFDWRIGVLDGRALYACKYFMAGKHWQIVDRGTPGRIREGRVETLPVEQAPARIVRAALKACRPIGRGLYGVDLKECRGRCYVIEVNDNPSLDAGCEDQVLKQDLYDEIMKVFLERLEARRAGKGTP